jgi:probable F420-dependent oxidoreductase
MTDQSSLKLGAVYPHTELSGSPDAVRAIGRAVEDLGYDHLFAFDHVLGAPHDGRTPPMSGPYTQHHPFHDPFVMFAYLAGQTTRLEFSTGVLVLPQRQLALVAKQAADLAILSGGRLRIGVAVGWNHVEYQALGADFSTRGARLDEQIVLLRRLWSESVVDFEGRFHRIDRAGINPRPASPIGIWIGGYGEVAYRRAARLGDGFIFSPTAGDPEAQLARLQAILRESGRSPESFGAETALPAVATPTDIVAKAERWANCGGTHAVVSSLGLGLDSHEAHIDYFGQVARALARC